MDQGEALMGRVVWRVDDDAEAALHARRAFRARLHALPAPRCDEDAAELIYGELVANTVRHAKGEVEVRLEIEDGDRVLVVRDHGPGLTVAPRAPQREVFAESGRGLAIVEMLAREVAVGRAQGGGTEVRAVLPTAA
jgi:anti-sigma regulatory factor (Ser/Thr protein kinase)